MAKYIQLTQGKVAMVSDHRYDYINQWGWYAVKHRRTWYAVRRGIASDGKRTMIWMHREIKNAPEGMEVDHRDHNGLNNQDDNLRICTTAQNQHNKNIQNNNTTGYKGVVWDKEQKLYRAQIRVNGRLIYRGKYKNIEEAARAYDEAAIKYFGEFAKLNYG